MERLLALCRGATDPDGGLGFVRTLSAQAKRHAEVARKDQQAAEEEEAALAAELVEAEHSS